MPDFTKFFVGIHIFRPDFVVFFSCRKVRIKSISKPLLAGVLQGVYRGIAGVNPCKPLVNPL
jgi:hypothetical protein